MENSSSMSVLIYLDWKILNAKISNDKSWMENLEWKIPNEKSLDRTRVQYKKAQSCCEWWGRYGVQTNLSAARGWSKLDMQDFILCSLGVPRENLQCFLLFWFHIYFCVFAMGRIYSAKITQWWDSLLNKEINIGNWVVTLLITLINPIKQEEVLFYLLNLIFYWAWSHLMGSADAVLDGACLPLIVLTY